MLWSCFMCKRSAFYLGLRAGKDRKWADGIREDVGYRTYLSSQNLAHINVRVKNLRFKLSSHRIGTHRKSGSSIEYSVPRNPCSIGFGRDAMVHIYNCSSLPSNLRFEGCKSNIRSFSNDKYIYKQYIYMYIL